MSKQSHYPTYNVMRERKAWDEHTRSIVQSRLDGHLGGYQFLTLIEAEMLRALCSLLVDDDRQQIIQYVLGHIDETLHRSIGEGQRKAGVPKADKLIRQALSMLEKSAQRRYAAPFISLKPEDQLVLLQELSEGRCTPTELWMTDEELQKPFFEKVLKLTLDAYYSHPLVWSEIGYGGPAYPRGYVRTQFGQIDPWEAERES